MYSKEEVKQLRKDFWTLFGSRSKPVLAENFRKHWLQYRTKITGLEFKFSATREDVKVILEINHKNENRRLLYFEKLTEFRPILEQGFDNGLEWELVYTRSAGNEVCRIFTKLNDVDIHRKEDWPQMFEFMTNNMIQFENNFFEIWDVLKEELK